MCYGDCFGREQIVAVAAFGFNFDDDDTTAGVVRVWGLWIILALVKFLGKINGQK